MYAIFKDELVKQAKDIFHQHEKFENGEYSQQQLIHHQEKNLKEVLKYVIDGSGFYKKHLSGITASDIDKFSLSALSTLPFTTKNDLRENRNCLASAPLDKSWIYYETTGTTGAPTPCPRSEIDSIYNNTPLILRYGQIFQQHGDKHIVGVMGPTELHSTGDTFEDVFRSLGHSVVKMWPRSPVVGMNRTMALINELQITALVCTPAVAINLARYLKKHHVSPAETSVRVILTLGELTTPALLRNIGETWGAQVYNCMYASQESSILAVCDRDQSLYTVPMNNYYELVDPNSGEVLPASETETSGELVITHLYQGQKPLIRYRTGDMVRATRMSDGRLKIVPIGRVRDTLTLGGCNYCAWDIEAALLEKLTGCLDYAIQIDEKNGIDHLNIIVELIDDIPQQAVMLAQTKAYMADKIRHVEIDIQVGETTNITSTSAMVSWKAARLHDLRAQGDNADRDAAIALLGRGFQ
ncbi:Phenylacetate-coenzyme A ligase [Vibrio ruber DSM 16370]|uniref:Phenylacetate-coenzyme A ligase n=1 Tax=Vibrio ruber (strain DSM 16370 / JCM 11486 / BCRC 17186 / CECT 7878 / LMG 23124 / VR1) TaxID=1123498 RepID=A0A1R4LRA6_VIBR1|nr:AMP-binding protein [Vibrio ruber]SJN58993.1 Phenylacetate-coenzyme A ligase [Vibrio ruber DSM 16370]